ncbi:MAG: NUDIX hydrolase [Symbiobacteriia bacterium]
MPAQSRRMITFDDGDVRFTHRVAGIAVQDGHVLLQQAEADGFWFTPGGRIELMEPSTAALQREMKEELGVAVVVGRLLWVVENFFEFRGRLNHEVGLYFEMTVPSERGPANGSFGAMEGDQAIPCVWHPLDEAAHLSIVPSFLQEALTDLPETPVHVVNVNMPKTSPEGSALRQTAPAT